MIGIVVVSHSFALATAAVGLADEMVDATDRPVIEVAAGLDETTFGTDAAAVAGAIGRADRPGGVLVICDLGSAVLSAEMACELVDPAVAARVRVSSAPLVEGLVAAVVTAAGDAPLDDVAREAGRGLAAKQQHLADVVESSAGADHRDAGQSAGADATPIDETAQIQIDTEHGLHARPAARLVAVARAFDAAVSLTNLETGEGPVDAASLSLVATLDAHEGTLLRVDASGPDAAAAVRAIVELASRHFDDRPTEDPAWGTGPSQPAPNVGDTTAAGSGLDIAIGPAVLVESSPDLTGYTAGQPAEEMRRFRDAISASAAQLERLGERADAEIGHTEAGVFSAQRTLMEDPALLESVEGTIAAGVPAPRAWSDQLDQLATRFDRLSDDYQRARAQDVRSVRDRVLRRFVDAPEQPLIERGVLVVPELDAATAATLDVGSVLGIVTVTGGATGHGVIVAKSRGIPIITDVGSAAADMSPGVVVAFDASMRQFVVAPNSEQQLSFQERIRDRARRRAAAGEAAHRPAVTADGCRIEVMANVGSMSDATAAAGYGADGSGLVRTEVLFARHSAPPDARTQAEAFTAIAAALSGRPITIRTFDLGGDKPLPFLALPAEPNPFLGERGIRVFRGREELLREQLVAVCWVARQTPVRVMFPMVATPEEVTWCLEQLADAASRCGGVPDGLAVGIMVEIPAAALCAARLAADLDFVSIGTNDLTQYTLAADRTNSRVAALADQLNPAVLGLIGRVCTDAGDHVEVAVCGDLASDPDAAPLLAGLGVRELSAAAPAIPLVKARLRSSSLQAGRELAAASLELASADDVRRLISAHPAAAPSPS